MSAAPGDVTGPVAAIRRARLSAHDAAAVPGLGRDGLAEVRLDPAGMVAEVRPDSGRPVGDAELDLNGLLLLPAGAEPHTHLDKAIVWDVMNPEYGDLASGIRQWQAYAAGLTEDDFVRRGLSVAREFVANGVTAIRTHAEIFPTADPGGDPLKSVRAMVAVREAMRPYCDIQVVVLPKNNIADDVIRRALEAGADLIGGSPHNTPDPSAELARLLALAREGGVGIDIHADERLDPSSLTVWEMAKDVLVSPLAGTVTAGHCTSLGLLSRDLLDPVAADLAAAGVGVIAAPITNLYLQGRDRPVATPRGITAVRALMEEGVLVAGAGDNVRDPINPVGAADAFTTASLMVSAAHLTIEEAYASVSEVARAIMGLPRAGVRVGDVADLLAVDSPTLASAVAGTAHERVVLFRGRVVSERRSVLRTAF